VRFRLLGTLEVEGLADDTLLRRTKLRALLALLLLHANRPVSRDALVEGLWGEHEPTTARGALQNYVSQVRKALGADVIVTREPGYVAAVDRDDVDVLVFERLVASAAEAEAQERAACLREALALWRGPALADLAEEPFARGWIGRLEGLRVTAFEDLVAA
jgi:DNA-binding SARP family transcriptional activator